MTKLLKVINSTKKGKKWTAIFKKDNGKEKSVHFGYDNPKDKTNDYTLHKDKTRRERYRIRHKKDLKTGDPMRAGFLSYYLLWGDSTSLKTNIRNYKKKFNL
tara:strand:+ start:13905 stop:14210 length:306 start_codon:yes stop_codon:yes gene_type:complete